MPSIQPCNGTSPEIRCHKAPDQMGQLKCNEAASLLGYRCEEGRKDTAKVHNISMGELGRQ